MLIFFHEGQKTNAKAAFVRQYISLIGVQVDPVFRPDRQSLFRW